MAKILNMPSPRKLDHDASCRSGQNRFLDCAGLEGVDTLILALEAKGKWEIKSYDERVEWYTRLAMFPMDVLCNAATVVLLREATPNLNTLTNIAMQMMSHRDTVEAKRMTTTMKDRMDENIGSTLAGAADGNPNRSTSIETDCDQKSRTTARMNDLVSVLTRIANTLEAIEFHIADRK